MKIEFQKSTCLKCGRKGEMDTIKIDTVIFVSYGIVIRSYCEKCDEKYAIFIGESEKEK